MASEHDRVRHSAAGLRTIADEIEQAARDDLLVGTLEVISFPTGGELYRPGPAVSEVFNELGLTRPAPRTDTALADFLNRWGQAA